MKRLTDLFENQLKDLYSTETQLLAFLPSLKKRLRDKNLKITFEKQLQTVREQQRRLVEIGDRLEIACTGKESMATALSIAQAVELFWEDLSGELTRVGLLEAFRRMVHYKISGYGTAVRYAKDLGLEAIAHEFQRSLEQEQGTDRMLGQMAEERLRAIP